MKKKISLSSSLILFESKILFPLSSLSMATCIVIPIFLKGSLRYLRCSHRIMYVWKCPLFSVQKGLFLRLKCVRVIGELRRTRFSGKDLEVRTQEGILEEGSWEPGERVSIQHRGQSSGRLQDPGQRSWSSLPGTSLT